MKFGKTINLDYHLLMTFLTIAQTLRYALVVFILSLIGVLTSSWMILQHPDQVLNEGLRREPLQTATEKPAFDVERQGVRYHVEPVFDYDIVGLIVSSHDSDSFFDISHRSWGDHINTGDLCIIWGSNLTSGTMKGMSFTSGDWTCYASSRSSEAWALFDMTKLSNNHVLPATAAVEKQLRNLAVGDEVRLVGQLVNYGGIGQPQRKSSTVRTDTGNGACEIIWVTGVEVLARHNKKAVQLKQLFYFLMFASFVAAAGAFAWPLVRTISQSD